MSWSSRGRPVSLRCQTGACALLYTLQRLGTCLPASWVIGDMQAGISEDELSSASAPAGGQQT